MNESGITQRDVQMAISREPEVDRKLMRAKPRSYSADKVIPPDKPKLLDQVRAALQSRHYSKRTEAPYIHWIKKFILFHNKRHPLEMGEKEINAFLTSLAVKDNISASTQNQALSAILFLYKYVLDKKLGDFGDVVRARKPKRLPVVFTKSEARAVIGVMQGTARLVAMLLYGAGLRLSECLDLRVKDLDFGGSQITVREGKGDKDRITMLPEALKAPLKRHLATVKALHESDLADGIGKVAMPDALDRKYPNASAEWSWQYVFPATSVFRDKKTGNRGRWHLHETVIQRAVKKAI